jgi:hypothetical protein
MFTTEIGNFIIGPPPHNGGEPQINEKDLWQAAGHRENSVCTCLPASPVGQQTGGEKLAGLLSPWKPLFKF